MVVYNLNLRYLIDHLKAKKKFLVTAPLDLTFFQIKQITLPMIDIK